MAEPGQRQPPQPIDLTSLSSQFRSAIQALSHEWGFMVVRTAYTADDNDDAQWATALSKLRAYAAPHDDSAEMDPDTFALPVIADNILLRDADSASVRKIFNAWVDDFTSPDSHARDNGQDGEEWPSDMRRYCCIVIDAPALASLLAAPDFVPGKIPKLNQEPWVVVVDGADPKEAPYRGGGPYLGFTRAYARVLSDLYDCLGFGSERPLASLTPVREYDGQIPLYDGSSRGQLVDPEGGVQGRYRFPRGTPRGAEGAREMLEEIERAVGRGNGEGN